MNRTIFVFRSLVVSQIILFMLVSPAFSSGRHQKIDAVSSATSLALQKKFPDGISLKIFGKVRKIYNLNSSYLSTLATVRIRTKEVDPQGEVTGAYIYNGFPVYFLLDGIRPQKNSNDKFDRPLDLIVTFISKTGKRSHFSYGELTMCNDTFPVTLAFNREPVLPSKDPESYKKNRETKPLVGLRLICPRDRNNYRYLDQVVSIEMFLPRTSDKILPKLVKGDRCLSNKLFCIKKGNKYESSFSGIKIKTFKNWVRIGHGRGIKSKNPETVSGYSLRNFLVNNFGSSNIDDFFMFVGCDGYRSLFSWSEIFHTYAGERMIIITQRNGKPIRNNITLGITNDFFVDRDIHGLSYIEKITFLE